MSNKIQIKPCANASLALRNIADQIDSGELDANVTVIAGTEIFQCGIFDDGRAAEAAIFNMNFAIHKLMKAVMDILD